MLSDVIDIVAMNQSLSKTDIANLQLVNTESYMCLFEVMQDKYKEYTHSDAFKQKVIRDMNQSSVLIDAFRQNNKIVTNMMYEYVMSCYENWHWISMDETYKNALEIPKGLIFNQFLEDHSIRIDDILPNFRVTYTHHHRPTKSFSYFKHINYSANTS